ncbi:putative reverse transcriptase domain, reverse transcriptase zinc-binding domain protein [Tanacetum coccineum]
MSYSTSKTEKEVIYLNKHDMNSLMKLDELHKFCDDTLLKVQENLMKMVNENRLGHGNKRLEGRDWSKNDIKRSNEMLEKIDKTLKRKEQLRRLEEYVGGRPKTFDPRTFVAALNIGDFYNLQYVKMYTVFIVQFLTVLPTRTNIDDAYANGNSEEQVDIGLVMGIAGTEVAKESNDISILDDNFASVVKVINFIFFMWLN